MVSQHMCCCQPPSSKGVMDTVEMPTLDRTLDMSRSYRKTPIRGITTKNSDKSFKTAEHKRVRRAVNACDLNANEPPAEKAFGNPWAPPKDGKHWFNLKRNPKAMRK